MKKFEGILICTDLDGTLLGPDKTVSKENLEAIEYFKAEGGIFTFITGRMPFFSAKIYEVIRPNAPFGCINGGGIYDHRTGQYVWRQELPRAALALVEYVDHNLPGIGAQVNTFDKIYFCLENSAMAGFRSRTRLPNLTCGYYDVKEPLAKIVFGDEREEAIAHLDALLHAHPMAGQFDFVHSEKALYEILPKGIHKGVALRKLCEHLGVALDRTVAVGDYDNDIGMLRTAKCGIAVSNAIDALKAVADHVTVSNEEHAIAKIVYDIERGYIKL